MQSTLTQDDGGRPEDCECWNPRQTLPCWSCFRDGFTTSNPDAPTEDD